MNFFMTISAKRFEIAVRQCQLRPVLQVLLVMDCVGLPVLAFALAFLTRIVIALQDLSPLPFPLRRSIKRLVLIR